MMMIGCQSNYWQLDTRTRRVSLLNRRNSPARRTTSRISLLCCSVDAGFNSYNTIVYNKIQHSEGKKKELEWSHLFTEQCGNVAALFCRATGLFGT